MSANPLKHEECQPTLKRQKLNPNISSAESQQLTMPDKVEHILQLPTEMIAEVLSYVSDHRPVSLTCQKFNDISCDSKFFELQICFDSRRNSEERLARFLDNDDTFSLMMKSKRSFNRMKISHYDCSSGHGDFEELTLNRLGQVLTRFGNDIKELYIDNIELPQNIAELLNLMPILVKIKLWDVKENSSKMVAEGELRLHKLKKFESNYCSAEVISIFNQLPAGVLQEISVHNLQFYSMYVVTELFPNQPNIKKASMDKDYADLFDWSQTKLNWLDIFGMEDLGNVLAGQDEVEYFDSYGFNQESLKLICNELKSLTGMRLGLRTAGVRGIPELLKLRKLKNLDLYFLSAITSAELNNFLSFTKSNSVEKLLVNCRFALFEITIAQLAVSFPHLKELDIYSKSSINIVNAIIHNFPNLESLKFKYRNGFENDDYIFQDGLTHEKLKKLQVASWEGKFNQDVLKLVGCCKELEELELKLSLPENSLKEILSLQPNLKSLTFNCYSCKRSKPHNHSRRHR